ncbi:beta-ketoacyl synthase N-terminal-like domain-containing protein [Gilvimarinus xylanilyticus]|uniref:Beta-ketoacyl synthase-like N-terminal domain-containing protein n=1 Tax=Gilvimarinus xylanilyticus TaxID=2944139 RepID=A0A9X2I3H1_9GAMM|nr:beta-ketoacyl synthase N-terminal-like domain-containing protein [Gilvimarinus xylanilyticus]MCP8900143.1 hypothetical protein [Gilvimarinus xylanilyticus]
MIYLIDSYSLLNTIAPNADGLPDLKAIIQRWHGERIRRIDRYIQLCVAGGLSCVAGRSLPENTGVYLASRNGAVATSARAMSSIEADGQLPKPLHFVNTLGNSAGFYLTQLLGLTGTAVVCSAEQLSFEAALTHACLDLQARQCDTALVGSFDETPLPVQHQRRRLNITDSQAPLLEGSHWLLLSRHAQNARAKLRAPEYTESLSQALRREDTGVQLAFSPNKAEASKLPGSHTVYNPVEGAIPHGSFSGAALVEQLKLPCGTHVAREGKTYCTVRWTSA